MNMMAVKTNIENIFLICSKCNLSMHTKNMFDFKRDYRFISNTVDIEIE